MITLEVKYSRTLNKGLVRTTLLRLVMLCQSKSVQVLFLLLIIIKKLQKMNMKKIKYFLLKYLIIIAALALFNYALYYSIVYTLGSEATWLSDIIIVVSEISFMMLLHFLFLRYYKMPSNN